VTRISPPISSTGSERSVSPSGGPSTLFLKNTTTPAPIRKLHVHVYFVAPCSVGSGPAGVCAPGDDSIPTLKRLELVAAAGATTMRLSPLVEGIEYLRVEYGVDSQPAIVNVATGLTGDSTIDLHTATPADWSQVIGAKVYVLARNTEPTTHHNDDKTYTLGATVVPATNDRFKRHVYAGAVRAMNPSGNVRMASSYAARAASILPACSWISARDSEAR